MSQPAPRELKADAPPQRRERSHEQPAGQVDFQDTGYGSAAATFVFFLVALASALYVMSMRVRAGMTTR